MHPYRPYSCARTNISREKGEKAISRSMVLSEINFIKQYCTLEQRHTDNNDAFKIRLYQKYVLVTTEHITISIVLSTIFITQVRKSAPPRQSVPRL